MNNTTILHTVFASVLGLTVDEVNDSIEYQGHPKWDSIGHMAIVAGIDKEFDLTIDMDDVIDMSSVGKTKEILGKYDISF